jgi:hypothetical protein
MGIVHRHKRRTPSGKMVTVRQHTRDTDHGPDMNERRPAAEDAAAAPRTAALPEPERREDDETWWDDTEPKPEPWMDTGGDEVEHEGHTFKVNRAPTYRPQGGHDFAKGEPER